MAAAFKVDFDGDPEAVEIQDYIKANGIDAAITNYTGLAADSVIFKAIKENM